MIFGGNLVSILEPISKVLWIVIVCLGWIDLRALDGNGWLWNLDCYWLLWNALDGFVMLFIALDCSGLFWIALDCSGLLWIALDCSGLILITLGWSGLLWIVLRIALNCPWLEMTFEYNSKIMIATARVLTQLWTFWSRFLGRAITCNLSVGCWSCCSYERPAKFQWGLLSLSL